MATITDSRVGYIRHFLLVHCIFSEDSVVLGKARQGLAVNALATENRRTDVGSSTNFIKQRNGCKRLLAS